MDLKRKEILKDALYDSHRHTAEMMVVAVNGNPDDFDILYQMAFSEKYPLNMRCANVCRLCCEQNPQMILPYLDELPEKIESNNTDGVKRGFLKIYAHCLKPQQFKNVDKLMEICFDYITDVKQALAVRVYCMDVAIKLCKLEPDLKYELIEIARFELESPMPGMQAKATKILKQLASL